MSSQQRVKLYNDWRGYSKGEVITVNKIVAHALVERSMGEYANPKKPKKQMKNIKGAPKNRMMKSASVSK